MGLYIIHNGEVMQRLGDIVAKDLSYIMDDYRDITRSVLLQCGSYKVTVYASLQADGIDFTADVAPINAFSVTLYYIESQCSEFNKCLKRDAIIFVDGTSYKIIDAVVVMGLRILSLERKGGR